MSSGARILIVDDDPSFAEIGELILSRAGYEVRRSESAAEALRLIKAEPPDMVISDVEMPEMDGFDLVRALRGNPLHKDIPVILMSARRVHPTDRVHGLDLGGDDYLVKPFSGDELVSRVKSVMRRIGKTPTEQPGGGDFLVGPRPEGQKALNDYMSLQAAAGPAPADGHATDHALRSETSPLFQQLRRRIGQGEPAALLCAGISFFKPFNDHYGFEKGDQVLHFAKSLMETASASVSDGKDAVEHVLGDDFMVLSTPERAPLLCHAMLQAFDEGVLAFYSEEDRTRGFLEIKNRQGKSSAAPFMNLVVGVATNHGRRLTHAGQFIQVGRELVAFAKSLGGSRFVIDRRLA